ncbi:MAG: hypothetical protein A3G33_09885 [Omnitrophica bacterium RIFCSPLOWO2_12_FULL_44_17]|uniref:Glutamate--cysteine ligase n=1 Tax=Candidatus Danuiimicrobium aquiferis TaxID=1801832 RepID=A0A1G1L105_9BACT|nr:MAG: hypothetical protein A3B72_11155 [Omnitrophica bacterium RIFCSPHIGHO2_02_FULL_45_28]OGW98857.1 MAG: hypothetical protein A3G33_09885 [Omnitrophica bacterium RIFCSPLOWO2_12_FULL_44_17]OGX04104.1 MAG: hypothetical protein A3J12_02250 [Omnitrophica bacterium RIFCSPLOWO2_02_FULL_44_11]
MARKQKQKPILTMGVELETYSIDVSENRICRDLHFPRKATVEKGEKFTRDWSIGSEYNSKVFNTIRESFFLLKTGLRKYTEFREKNGPNDHYVIFPIGGWVDRFAGTHFHLAVKGRKLSYPEAKELAGYIHDYIPFLIALCGNSPVWREKLTHYSSNRLLRGSEKYCKPTKRGVLYKHHFRELTYNRENKKKPPTLEIRIADASLPEYVVAALCVLRAIALKWVRQKEVLNQSTHANYLKARDHAIRLGPKAKIAWTNHWVSVPHYVDLFFRKYKDELEEMDIPEEIIRTFKYLKKEWNQAEVIRAAAEKYQRKHRPTWQRQFAKRYVIAIEELLDGNSFERFAHILGVKLPNIDRTWLGRKESNW